MAVVNIDRRVFEKEIGPLDAKMQEKIFMFGNPIQGLNDKELQIEVFPNRPDLLSYHGFKRAFLAFLGKETGLKSYKINKPEKNFVVTVDSSVKDIRPYTVCAIVKGLNLDDEKIKELIEVQEKLHLTLGRKRKKLAIGIYPLDKIKLPITFKALEPDQIKFIPLESERELSGLEILQRHPTGKEHAHLLAGKTKFPIFVDSDSKILSMPPIINSKETGRVTSDTKDIFIECSGFDLETLKNCLNILLSSMAEMGAKIYQMEIKYGLAKKEVTPDFKAKEIKVSVENINKLLGLSLTEKQIKDNLEKMGHSYNRGTVTSPAWRVDILHEVDIVEDVAIAYGYENFIPEIPEISTIGEESQNEKIKRRLSEMLIGLGMIEVSNYHLTTKKDQGEKMGISEKNAKFIEVAESKTDYKILRENLLHYILKNFSENVDSEYPQRIFEIGKVFKNPSAENLIESENMCVAISPGNFTEIKQSLEYVFRMSGLNLSFKEPQKIPEHFIDGRTAEVFLGKKSIGLIGEIHPKTLSNWKIRMPVALFEIELEDVLNGLKK